MSLADHMIRATVAVSDLGRARQFYEGLLGLSAEDSQADGYRVYPCGGGTSLHVYASPAHAGTSTATQATWAVPDVESAVDELTARGVRFERYGEPRTDAKGIHRAGYVTVAWFADPDGNVFAIERERSPAGAPRGTGA